MMMIALSMRPGEFKPYYFYRFMRWKLGDRSPITAAAKVTNKCNLKCDHCPWWRRDIKESSTKEWLRSIEKAREKGAIHLIIEGGEPTLREDLNVIIEHAKNLGMLVMVITNGTVDLSKFDPDTYWISVEGVGDTHDKNRGEGVFDRIVDNLRKNPGIHSFFFISFDRWCMVQFYVSL